MVIARRVGGGWFVIAGLLTIALAIGGQAVADGLSLKDRQSADTDTKRGVWFGGYDVVTEATYVYDGVVVALNRDISKDGWAVRVYGSRVDFDLDPGDGRGWQGDIMLGYMVHRPGMYGGIYVGADYQNYKLSPDDPTSPVRGTEWGFKVAGDIATSDERPLYLSLTGSYSTAFDSYWARARIGHNRGRVIYGVEGSVFGNEDFVARRLGGFLTFEVPLRRNSALEVTLAAGHQFVSESSDGGTTASTGGGEGTYGTIVISTAF